MPVDAAPLAWGVPGMAPTTFPCKFVATEDTWGWADGEGSGLGTYRTAWCRGKKFLESKRITSSQWALQLEITRASSKRFGRVGYVLGRVGWVTAKRRWMWKTSHSLTHLLRSWGRICLGGPTRWTSLQCRNSLELALNGLMQEKKNWPGQRESTSKPIVLALYGSPANQWNSVFKQEGWSWTVGNCSHYPPSDANYGITLEGQLHEWLDNRYHVQ